MITTYMRHAKSVGIVAACCVLLAGGMSARAGESQGEKWDQVVDEDSGASFLMPANYERKTEQGKAVYVSPLGGAYITFQAVPLEDAGGGDEVGRVELQSLGEGMKDELDATVGPIRETENTELKGWQFSSRWTLETEEISQKIRQDETVMQGDEWLYRMSVVSPPRYYDRIGVVYKMVVESLTIPDNSDANGEEREEGPGENQMSGPIRLQGGIQIGNEESRYTLRLDDAGRLHLLDEGHGIVFIVELLKGGQLGQYAHDSGEEGESQRVDGREEQTDARSRDDEDRPTGRGESNVIASTRSIEKGVTVKRQTSKDDEPVVEARVPGEGDGVEHRGYTGPVLGWDGNFGRSFHNAVVSDILVEEDGRMIELDGGRGMTVYERRGGDIVQVQLPQVGNILRLEKPQRRIEKSSDPEGGDEVYSFTAGGYKITVGRLPQDE